MSRCGGGGPRKCKLYNITEQLGQPSVAQPGRPYHVLYHSLSEGLVEGLGVLYWWVLARHCWPPPDGTSAPMIRWYRAVALYSPDSSTGSTWVLIQAVKKPPTCLVA